MGRVCTICTHPQHKAIDKAITQNVSNRTIADQYGLSMTSVQRHKQHIKKAVEAVVTKKILSQQELIAERFEDMYSDSARIQGKAEKAKQFAVALSGVRERRATLESALRFVSEWSKRSDAEQWEESKDAVFEVIDRYPEVREAVSAKLLAISDKTGVPAQSG